MSTAYLTHADCLLHENPDQHPESPARLLAIEQALRASGLWNQLQHPEVPLATFEQIARVHGRDYVELVDSASPESGYINLSFDAGMNPHTRQAAFRAAGAVIQAVDMVMFDEARNAFCAVRPPGHHAERELAMGFCIFNNVAVGAAHAMADFKLQRIAIIDFDVHHGNGTEEIFQRNKRVMLCSIFEHPLYPFSGTKSVGPNLINVPLPAGADGAAFRAAFTERCLPRLDAFKPELVFISAGFDAHAEEPLAHLNLHEADYTWLTQQIVALADRHASGRIVSVLEGGYNPSALARCVVAHVQVLCAQ